MQVKTEEWNAGAFSVSGLVQRYRELDEMRRSNNEERAGIRELLRSLAKTSFVSAEERGEIEALFSRTRD